MPDLVSVIIVNYNTFQLTCNCIQSVIDKTKGVPFEIILVDNASTECDPAQFKQRSPTIKLMRSTVNLGFAKGNNLGIREASGNYILLLNSDTELINDAVSLAYQRMVQSPEIGVLSGKLLYPDGREQPVAGRFPSIKKELAYLLRLKYIISANSWRKIHLGDLIDYNQEEEADWVWGAFFMFRKADLKKFPNQKLHDSFFMYMEDVQWCYYFKKRLGKKIVYYPIPQVIHYIGGSDKEKNKEEKYLQSILPNQYNWMLAEKGWLYTKIYYALYYLVQKLNGRNNELSQTKASFLWRLFISGSNV